MHTFSRLLETFSPSNYNLSLHLDRAARTFGGVVTITGTLQQSDYLPLHAKDLTIESASIDGKTAYVSQHEHDEIRLSQADLQPGEHIAVIAFSGTITDTMTGLYPCYFEHDGVKKELLTTQFESHHAREAFPCVDEPAAKATFDLTLSTEAGVEVLSNMPIAHQKPGSDTTPMVTVFETTPKMSTYLLAWVVGELHKQTAHTKSGVEVNVWATPAQPAANLAFALDIATRCIDFYDDYFGVPYPLPKCDHVALPDFSSGAMENWGLITYREIALLASPHSSVDTRRYVATVITHELAHQWFGNLVTMQWWDDLWLNESFATMMEYIAVDTLEPSWNIWRDFAANEAVMALRRDSLDGVQPVHLPVNHPDEISTLFDGAIVYAKGAKLMRMMQYYIGDADFRAGLRTYFTKFAHQNTTGQDLWDTLGEASGKDISGLMNAWIHQSGFPLVTITETADGTTLTQSQFFVGPHQPSTQTWPIPLAATNPDLPAILESKSHTTATTEPFFLNNEDTSHFITHYPASFIQARLADIRNLTASEITRLQFLHEQTLLAKAGIIQLADILPTLDAYRHETNEAVWGIISLAIGEIRRTIEGDDDTEARLKQYVAALVRPQYDRLGWQAIDGESDNDAVLRGTIISLMLYAEDKDAISTAHQLYTSSSLHDLNPELRASLIANEVRHFKADITALLATYAKETDGDVQGDLASGITATRTPAHIQTILTALQQKDTIRPQDVFRWFAYLMRNRHTRTATWQWMRDNWQWIEQTFASDKSLDYFPRYAANSLCTASELTEYTAFFTPHLQNQSLARAITIGEGEITGRIEQTERDKPAIIAALQQM